jgi:hypothetical protein
MTIIQYFAANQVVILIVLAVMILLYLSALAGMGPDTMRLSGHHRSTAIASLGFFTTFLCFFAEYVIAHLKEGLTPEWQQTLHVYLHVASTVFGSLASVCTLIAALSYLRGGNFDFKSTAIFFACYVFAIFLWAVAFESFNHDNSLFATTFEASPVILTAAVAAMALGWAFLARWGLMAGAPFFLVCFLYGILQLPAYLRGELGDLEGVGAVFKNSDLDFAFPLLAGGKFLLAFGFISLLCSSAEPGVDIDNPRYWPPADSVRPPNWMLQVAGWIGTTVLSGIAAAATDPLKPLVVDYLHRLIGR